MMSDLPRVVDLFCGAGGMSLGFQAAGCHINAAVDLDTSAGKSFQRNFSILQPNHPPVVHAGANGDLNDPDTMRPERIASSSSVDILIGGPPCQAFSRLGRGKLDSLSDEGFAGDPRNQLYRRFLEAVDYWQPRALVIENVPGMLNVAGINYADVVCGELAELGYQVGFAVLNAVWYGVPQFRERLFFLGLRADLELRPIAPPRTHHVQLPEGYRVPTGVRAPPLPFGGEWNRIEGELPVPGVQLPLPAVTVSHAIDDLPELKDHLSGNALPCGDYRRSPKYQSQANSDFARLMQHWPGFSPSNSVTHHVTRRTPRDFETFRRMKHGDRYPEALGIARERFNQERSRLAALGEAPEKGTPAWNRLEARFVPPYNEKEFVDKWRKLIPDQPSWTLPAHLSKDSYSHIHPDHSQARMISVREAARLQSFPDAFGFCGNMGECFRQIGNAVPPLLAWAIGFQLLATLGITGNPPPTPESLPEIVH